MASRLIVNIKKLVNVRAGTSGVLRGEELAELEDGGFQPSGLDVLQERILGSLYE